MVRAVKITSMILLFISLLVPFASAEPLQDQFYNQGQEVMNAPIFNNVKENIDLFSGNLNLTYTDAHFPGNGGLDLTLIRKYSSAIWGKRDVGSQTLVASLNASSLGLGWIMHMGVARNPQVPWIQPGASWSLVPQSGSLPDGLILGVDGTIFGTPTTAGTYSFTIQLVNQQNVVVKTLPLSITVYPSGATLPDANAAVVGVPYEYNQMQQANYKDTVFGNSSPCVEMPDGSQHQFYNEPGRSDLYISRDFWKYQAINDHQWQMTLTDGTIYTFEYLLDGSHAGYLAYPVTGTSTPIAQVIRIQNAAGTASISVTYNQNISQGNSFINTITDSTGRVITFHYNQSGQLDHLSFGNKTLMSYSYQSVSGPNGAYSILSAASPPLGASWHYTYNSIYELETLTYPAGGTITYQYTDTPFYIKPYDSTLGTTVHFSVVTSKTKQNINANDIIIEPTGTWTYNYVTGGPSTTWNITTVNGPDGTKEVHQFYGWGMATSGFVWAIGLPISKELSQNGHTYYFELNGWSWIGPISNTHLTNAGWNDGVATAKDGAIVVPVLTSKDIVTDDNGTIEWDNNNIPVYDTTKEIWEYGYSTIGQIQTTVYNSYDGYGNPTSITEQSADINQNEMPARNTSKTYFNNTGANIVSNKPLTITVTGDSSGAFPGNFVINNTYDYNSGNLTQMTKYGVPTSLGYDPTYGNVSSITDANHHTTNFTWDKGRISQKQNSIYSISRVINDDGTIASETDGNSNTTSYTYDANFRLTSKSPPGVNQTTITYDPSNTFKTTTRDQYWSTTYYDGFGNSAKTVDSIGVRNDIVYTAYGPKNYTSSSTGDTVYYDFLERPGLIVHQDNSFIEYNYWGSYTWVYDEKATVVGQNDTQLVYQTFGSPNEKWLTKVIDALSSSSTYSYNAVGSLTQTTQPGQQPGTFLTRTFHYDPTNNFLDTEKSPDRGLIQYTRDSVGNIRTKSDGMGTTSYTYDDLNRLTQTCTTATCASSGIVISYTYDNADNRLTTNYAAPNLAPINYTYSYDPTNKLKQKDEQMGTSVFTTKYDYDMDDNLTVIYYPSTSNRHIQYTYNANNQVTSVPGFVNNISYYQTGTPLGLPYQYTYANNDTMTLTYNSRNLTTNIAAGASTVNMTYAYDKIGNTSSITDNLNPVQNQALFYDNLNRLTVFDGMWGSGGFSYDALGNRQSKSVGSNSINYGYDANNRLASASSGGNVSSYHYNFDGDLTGIENIALTYDELHNLVSYGTVSAPQSQYAYDGNSMRVSKTTSDGKTIVYHYDQGGRILSESDNSGNFISDYVYLHGKLLAKVVNTATSVPVPAAPTNLTASAVSSSVVNLSWTNNATNADGYTVERKAGAGGAYSQVASVASSSASYSDIDLTEHAPYVYRVRVFNLQSGYSPYSNEATATTPPATVPIAPSGLIAAATGYNQVSLAWTNNAINADGVLIERKIASGGTYTQIASLPTNTATSYGDVSVSPNTTYSYRIRAYNILGGSLYSNEATITTQTLQGGNIITVAGNGQAASSGDGGPAILASVENPRGVALDSVGNHFIADSYNIRKVDVNNEITTAWQSHSGEGVAVDSVGNIYLADPGMCAIWKKDAVTGAATIVAGYCVSGGCYCGYSPQDGNPATQAVLNNPTAVAVDTAGNIYIADTGNHMIRMVDTSGIIYTVAGTTTPWFGGDGGTAIHAGLNHPMDVKVDTAGNIYIADQGNARIRKITNGVINTIAGNGQVGFSGDGGPATLASFYAHKIALDTAGNIYIAGGGTNRIRVVSTTGFIYTIAGNGSAGFSGDGGPAMLASFNTLGSLVVDTAGNILVGDTGNNRVREILAPLIMTTSLPLGTIGMPYSKIIETAGAKSPYTWLLTAGALPAGLTLNNATGLISGTPISEGISTFTVQLTDAASKTNTQNLAISIFNPLLITTTTLPSGVVGTTYNQTMTATGGFQPYTWAMDGLSPLPDGLALDSATGVISGTPTVPGRFVFNVKVTDANGATSSTSKPLWINISPRKAITTYSFTSLSPARIGVIDETAKSISVIVPYGTDVTALVATFATTGVNVTVGSTVQISGTTPNNFASPVTYTVIDTDGSSSAYTVTVTVAAYDPSIITTIAGNGVAGFSGDGGPAIQASLYQPCSMATDSGGNVYISDSENYRVRMVNFGGVITTIAGNGQFGYSGDGGQATQASLSWADDIAVDSIGNVYLAEYDNYRIRKVNTSGIISTIAGNGQSGFSGDGGQATQAKLSACGVAVDSAGNVYIADCDNYRVRKVNTSGVISTFAGNGQSGFSGDGGQAKQAMLSAYDLAVDTAGNIYIADEDNNRIRKINTSGVITTIAGNGQLGYSGDGGQATLASLDIYGVAADSAGNVYIADGDYRVRKVNTSGIITTVVGNGQAGFSGDGGPATLASISPDGVAVSSDGTLYIADVYYAYNTNYPRIRKVTFPGPTITTSSLASGATNTAYSQTLTATGGTTPYSWSVTTGSLPTGLSLTASTGVISGTPTAAGTSTFTVQVKDKNNLTSTKSLSITITAPLAISTASLPNGAVSEAYSQTLAATGGTTPYTWSITTGTLPAGLGLASTGVISGTPTAAGTATITFKVTDAASKTSTKSLSITINAALSITTSTLTFGTTSKSYSQTLAAAGGITPYTWSITTGSLPTGLSLAASTGVISGTPTTAGTSTFTVQVKDANNKTITKSLSISVYAPLSVTTSSLPAVTHGTSYSQTLAATGGKTPYTWSISSGSLPTGLTLAGSTGVISGKPTTAGTYSFTVKATDANASTATKALSIKVN